MKSLNKAVYPSTEPSVHVEEDDTYGGAHRYFLDDCYGFTNGKTNYDHENGQEIVFIKKEDDGTILPGCQSEQLLIALIDRHKKLNERFPSREGALAITKMEEALHWLQARVEERVNRNVMGELKK